MAYDDLFKGYREATRGLQEQGASERDRVMREYDRQRDTLQQQLGGAERDIQRTLGQLRTAERREQRRRDLPTSRPRDLGTRANIESVRNEGERYRREIRDLQARVEQARGESVRDLEQQVRDAQRDLDKWYRDARAAQREYEREAKAAKTATVEATPQSTVAPAYDDAAEYYREYAPKADPFAGATAKAGVSTDLAATMAKLNAEYASKTKDGIVPQKATPKSIIGVPVIGKQSKLASMSQAELKAEYEKWRNKPWWLRVFSDQTVIQLKDGTYVPVIAGYAPAVAPAQRAAQTARVATKVTQPWEKTVADALKQKFIVRTPGEPIPKNYAAVKRDLTRYLPTAVQNAVKNTQARIVEKVAQVKFPKPSYKPQPSYKPPSVTGNKIFAEEAKQAARQWTAFEKRWGKTPRTAAEAIAQKAVQQNQVKVSIAPAVKSVPVVKVAPTLVQAFKQANAISPQLARTVAVLVGFTASVNAAEGGATMPQIRQATQAAIRQATAAVPSTKVNTQAATRQAMHEFEQTQQAIATSIVQRIDSKTKPVISERVATVTRTPTVPVEDIAVSTVQQPAFATQVASKIATSTTTKTQTPTKTTTTTKTKPPSGTVRSGTSKPPIIRLPLPDGESLVLTRQQYAGIVAWKQGLFYILVYPPYGKAQTVYTRKPVMGIQYGSGPGSPQRTARVVGGKLPRAFELAMGVTKVKVQPGVTRGKPKLKFRARETVEPEMGEVRRLRK